MAEASEVEMMTKASEVKRTKEQGIELLTELELEKKAWQEFRRIYRERLKRQL